MRRAHAAAGFTLIEVLVALVIVAVGMAAVMSALSSSANTLSFLRDETFAQWLALNQIATLRLSAQQPPVGNSSGDTDFAGRSWHWRQEVVTTDVPGVVRIDVKVRPKEVQAGDDEAWTTTVSGIYGGSVGRADGYNPDWRAQAPRYVANPNGANGTGIGTIGSNTGSSMQIAPAVSGSGLGSPDSGLGSSTTLDSGLDSSGSNPPPPPPTPQSQQ
jgi:general secretion pathway protein I